MQTRQFYQFGRHLIDTSQRVLLSDGKVLHLTPKAFEILLALVERRGEIVDKDALMKRVWPDSFVEESNLAFNISLLRDALCENGSRQTYIETVRGRGYRFVADVTDFTGDRDNSLSHTDRQEDPEGDDSNVGGSVAGALDREGLRGALVATARVPSPVWPRRGLLAATAGIFFLTAVFDVAVLRPPEMAVLRDLGLLVGAAMCVLVYARARPTIVLSNPELPQTGAFRGLVSFEPADASRFFGRDVDTDALFDLVTHSEFHFGVLYGDSGCGKTSLLRAGLLPRLEHQGYLGIYCRSYKDPVAALTEECYKKTRIARAEGQSFVDYLTRVARKRGSAIVIICDQFEEFFINFKTRKKRAALVSLVASCYRNDASVKFLFSIRSDFLYQVAAAFDDQIQDTLATSKRYHLRLFDEQQAAEIIEKSVRRANWQFEAGLSQIVAHDLAVNDEVQASELQILGEQLQHRRIFTIKDYNRAGGRPELVHGYLEDVIALTGEPETAKLLLRCMISDDHTRLTLTLAEIARRVQRSQRAIERILGLFQQMRLIRVIQEDTPWRYELVHEYLIEKIDRITGRVMDATERANRQFRQYLSAYNLDRRSRIPLSRLWLIARYSDLERGAHERELIRKSLRAGLMKLSVLGLLLTVTTISAAAWLSVHRVWDDIRVLSDGDGRAGRRAVYSPDGRLVVSVSENSKVVVWNPETRERLKEFQDHQGWVNCVAFSPDGKWFVTGSDDKTVIVWDARRLEKTKLLRGHLEPVNALAFSPNGKYLVTGSADRMGAGRTIVWSTDDWQELHELPVSAGHISFAFSRDGRLLMLPSSQTWDLATGLKASDKLVPDCCGNWMAVSPDGKLAIGVGGSGEVRFVDLTSHHILSEQRAHRDIGRAAAFSPDGRLAATGAEDIVLWDAVNRSILARLPYSAIVWSLDFSPNGRQLVSTHGDGATLVWDVAERQLAANLNEHGGPVRAVAFSPDGNLIASASEDRSVIVWDAATGRKKFTFRGHGTRVMAVAFLPDGKSALSGDMDGEVKVWDIWTQQTTLEFGRKTLEFALAVSPEGRWIATSRGVYDSGTGGEVVDFGTTGKAAGGEMYGVAFSADGRRLACVSPTARVVSVWDTQSWEMIDRIQNELSAFVSVCFSPDGKQLVTGDDEGKVRLFEAEPLREIAILGSHNGRIKSVAFSPKGAEVASAGDDRQILLWSVRDRKLVDTIGTHTSPVLSVAFSKDGKRIVSGEHDSQVRVYTSHNVLWGHRID